MNKCEKCGFMHYRTDPCRKPKKVYVASEDYDSIAWIAPVIPKPKRSGNRHRPGYFTEYIRKYRGEVKAGIRVPKPRKVKT